MNKISKRANIGETVNKQKCSSSENKYYSKKVSQMFRDFNFALH